MDDATATTDEILKRGYQKMKLVAIVHDRTIARLPDRINKVRLLFFDINFLNFVRRSCRVVHRKVSIPPRDQRFGVRSIFLK